MKKHLLLISLAASTVLADTFTLGQINVLNVPLDESPFEQVITSDTIATQNSETVSDALDNISGINQDVQGGRGESTLYIRGFDARRIGVFIDGIPIYVPYDGNFDYDRFLTNDIAEIDVEKGYSSIVYGANTMGGVVNIVSKRPTKALEGDMKVGMVLDSDTAFSRKTASLNLGTRQDHLYAQLGAVYSDQSHFRLSDNYTPPSGSVQPKGDRLHSQSEDYKISLKGGYIADDGSEVAIGYSNQNGQKQQPPVSDPAYSQSKYWDWPYWDKETLFISGQKNLAAGYIKALAYYDTSKNSLYAYDNVSYSTMNTGKSFKSKYDDYSYGGRLEYGVELEKNFLTAAANYKKDSHKGYDISKTTGVDSMSENYEDHSISLGLEDTYTVNTQWQLLGGVSYDRREGDKIFDTNTAYINMLALKTQSSINPQAAVIFTPDTTSKIRASVSKKTYMPSMKDRYSRKFNSSVPNVDLQNEVATHYELSYQKQLGEFTARLNGFFTRQDDAIQSVVYAPNPAYTQNQNVGSFDHRGVETELNYKSDGLEAGGNYTYISVKNRTNETIKQIDVPKHQIFAFAQKELGCGFSLYGDMKFRKGAYEQKADKSYVINPTFTTFDIKGVYKATEAITAEIGIKNLTDKLYAYDLGFPMAGREFFANLRYTF
ncbi:TonB-dependent receptor [Sulfuricurvum sp.]|uniref:TonB-dependent receptor plug domain-containing protein n=1 Tax=Sulfuricurvum sp. TaxID=2025608 RepID=UPI002D55929A|nr:TonB-dependent receptor [Sulfuricurvum sp.]HZF71276.1 TonB-dependent receptor [Sulfuricurvum sp.]